MFDRIEGLTILLCLMGVLLLWGVGACSSTTTDFGEPLSIALTVDRAVGVAGVDTFSFRYDATGTSLMGIVLEFGDGQADSLSAQGATSAGATRSHVYAVPGAFSAVATVLEAFGEARADTVVVEIQNP